MAKVNLNELNLEQLFEVAELAGSDEVEIVVEDKAQVSYSDVLAFDYRALSDRELSALRQLLSAESDRRYPRV